MENFLLEAEAIYRALRRAGVHRLSNAQEVEEELKRVADELRDETLARWVGASLNEELGWQDYRIRGGRDPVAQLQAKAAAASERTQETLHHDRIAKLIDQKRAALEEWDDGLWRKLVPGRRVLREFVGGLRVGLSYEQLRSLVLAEMRDDRNLFPKEFGELAREVLNGLD